MGSDGGPTRVLFVCLGNICRSPTAHGVFESLVKQHGHEHEITVDSCGTGSWHVGKAPDRRATAEAAARGYALDHLRARQVRDSDFFDFDHIIAMDRDNLEDLQRQQPANSTARLALMLDFGSSDELDEVPDPYYGGDDGFGTVLDLIEDASQGLLRSLVDGD